MYHHSKLMSAASNITIMLTYTRRSPNTAVMCGGRLVVGAGSLFLKESTGLSLSFRMMDKTNRKVKATIIILCLTGRTVSPGHRALSLRRITVEANGIILSGRRELVPAEGRTMEGVGRIVFADGRTVFVNVRAMFASSRMMFAGTGMLSAADRALFVSARIVNGGRRTVFIAGRFVPGTRRMKVAENRLMPVAGRTRLVRIRTRFIPRSVIGGRDRMVAEPAYLQPLSPGLVRNRGSPGLRSFPALFNQSLFNN